VTIHETTEEIIKKLRENESTKVSVALFGQPGAGKSSLINKIIGRKEAAVGVQNDVTHRESKHEWNGISFSDLPGYDTKAFPKEGYFERFDIQRFDIFLCVTSGKLHASDIEFFKKLEEQNKKCIYVVNKRDQIWEDDRSIEDLEKEKIADICKNLGKNVIVKFTSCKDNYGIDDLIQTIKKMLEPAKADRWIMEAKAYSKESLDAKKKACERYITIASLASAANGINPLVGVNSAVDIGIIVTLFRNIADSYGLNNKFLDALMQNKNSHIVQMSASVLNYLTRDGVLILLKKVGGRVAVSAFARYIPFIGQAISAGLGYALVSNAGKTFLGTCHELAGRILEEKLRPPE
jgi:small GTP-binding protein